MLEHAATDARTALSDRRGLTPRAQYIGTLCRRAGLSATVVGIDLDNFKRTDTEHGHAAGHEARRAFARMLQEQRMSDVVARLGGDDFALWCSTGSPDPLGQPLQRVRGAVAGSGLAQQHPSLCSSAGLATIDPPSNADSDHVLRDADQNMYSANVQAKRSQHPSRTERGDATPVAKHQAVRSWARPSAQQTCAAPVATEARAGPGAAAVMPETCDLQQQVHRRCALEPRGLTRIRHRAWTAAPTARRVAHVPVAHGPLTRARLALPALALLTGAGSAVADVVSTGPAGFVVRTAAVTDRNLMAAWRRLVRVQDWWSTEHTYSGDAANLSLDLAPGGCWCEKLPGGGFVRHMEVVYAAPRTALRLVGGLGPLQGMGASGALTFTLKATGPRQTAITAEYAVTGSVTGVADLAAAVDGVLTEQLRRYAGP
jgi:diguanylate cyclase (GGDEF)-like protein